MIYMVSISSLALEKQDMRSMTSWSKRRKSQRWRKWFHWMPRKRCSHIMLWLLCFHHNLTPRLFQDKSKGDQGWEKRHLRWYRIRWWWFPVLLSGEKRQRTERKEEESAFWASSHSLMHNLCFRDSLHHENICICFKWHFRVIPGLLFSLPSSFMSVKVFNGFDDRSAYLSHLHPKHTLIPFIE